MRVTNDDSPLRHSPPAAPLFVVVFINGPDQPRDLVKNKTVVDTNRHRCVKELSAAAGLAAKGRPWPTQDASHHSQNATWQGTRCGRDRADLAWTRFWAGNHRSIS